MTPIVLILAASRTTGPTTRPRTSRAGLLVTNVLDLFSTEFLYRGFLMLALARSSGRSRS
jgi:hypothetical protein